ncbi:Uncharacterized protein FKW44_017158, partial [Caligus rogercresseyi]
IERTELPPLLLLNKDMNETDIQDTKADIMLSYSSFLGRTWTLVVISGASIGICVALWMLIYVTIKIFDRTLHGNQTMGILLLISVVGLFTSVAPWLVPPSPSSCYARHIMHPIFIVICFGILLVKSMQLRSLINVGHGGTIPQVNQILSLLFMIAVQIVITVEWYMSLEEPMRAIEIGGYPVCSNASQKRFLLLHLYPCLLLLLAFVYGVSVIKIRHNYNEGRWITCATLLIIPVFIVWSLIYVFAPIEYQDPSVALSVTTISCILLLSIFAPKMNTINKKSGIFRKLKRSGSDTTVYTAFSGDLLLHPQEAGMRKIPVISSSPSSGHHPRPFHPPPHMFHHRHHHHHGPHHRHHHHPPPYRRLAHPYPIKPTSKIRFNGLNYVNATPSGGSSSSRAPHSSTTTSSSYRDWKQNQHYAPHSHHQHRDVYVDPPPLIKEMTQSEEENDSTLSEGNNDVTVVEGDLSPRISSDLSASSLKKYTASNTNANAMSKAIFATHNRHAFRGVPQESRGILSHKNPSRGPPHSHHHTHLHHHHGGHGRHGGHHHHHVHRSHSPTDGMILTPTGLYHY